MEVAKFLVPHSRPSIDREDIEAVVEAMKSGWLTHGYLNTQLEEVFAARLGVAHAVSLNSCTSALFLALKALGIRGEVIIPSFTFVATANAVCEAGARPVFADIQYDTCNLDPQEVEKKITSRTEAIIPVHFAGQCCDMDQIMALARCHRLAVIEDSAETLGGAWAGKPAGSFGVGCFSLFPTKNITTFEGGFLATADRELADRVRALSAHGMLPGAFAEEKAKTPWFRAATFPGYNFRMTHPQAALGIKQLEKLDRFNALRRRWGVRYLSGLNPEYFDLPVTAPEAEHVYQMFTIKVKDRERNCFVSELRRLGIEATVHFYPPVHEQAYYRQHHPSGPLPITERVANSIVTLPLFPAMTEPMVDQVIAACHQAYETLPLSCSE